MANSFIGRDMAVDLGTRPGGVDDHLQAPHQLRGDIGRRPVDEGAAQRLVAFVRPDGVRGEPVALVLSRQVRQGADADLQRRERRGTDLEDEAADAQHVEDAVEPGAQAVEVPGSGVILPPLERVERRREREGVGVAGGGSGADGCVLADRLTSTVRFLGAS